MAFYGIDLHTNRFTAGFLITQEEGVDIKVKTYNLEETDFFRFKECLTKDDYILVEACTNAFWFCDEVEPYVKKCLVYNPKESGKKKTDKIDARKLTRLLAFYVFMGEDPKVLDPVYKPDLEVRELRSLFTTYRGLKKQVNQTKNRIHTLLVENGYRIGRRDLDNHLCELLETISLSEGYLFQITELYDHLHKIQARQDRIKDMIFLKGYEIFHDEVELLITITGLSPLIAFAFMADVVDVERFSSAKRICSYLRTAPKVKSSNETTRIGNILRASRSTTCSLLSQSVNHFKTAGPHLTEFYERVKVGKKAGKSIMALLRKIVVCAYNMLKKHERFRWVKEDLYKRKMRELHNRLKRIRAEFRKEKLEAA